MDDEPNVRLDPAPTRLDPELRPSPAVYQMRLEQLEEPSFGEVVIGGIRRFFSGRIGRLRYVAETVGLMGAFGLVVFATERGGAYFESALMQRSFGAFFIVTLVLFFAGFLRIMIRRLHDTGFGGGKSVLLVLAIFLPLLSFIAGLYLLFAPGDPFQNEYGPPPG